MKTCTRCGHTKPLTEYHLMSKSRDGHRAQCRDCIRAYEAQRRAENGDKIRARERRRYHNPNKAPTVLPDRCHYPGCRRGQVHDGLCDTHHDEVSASRESPLALTGGRWEKSVGGVRRWVA